MSNENIQPNPPAATSQPKFELPRAVTLKSLEDLPKIGNVKAVVIYDLIASIGGFGVFNDAFRPALDVSGLSDAKRREIDATVAELIK
jgi:hypothetical protein